MNEERRDDYLAGLDSAADWQPEGAGWDFPLSFDEWNAARLVAGLPECTFDEYLAAIGGDARRVLAAHPVHTEDVK